MPLKAQFIRAGSMSFGFGYGSSGYGIDSSLNFFKENYSEIPEFARDLSKYKNGSTRSAFLRQIGLWSDLHFNFRDSANKRRNNPVLKLAFGLTSETIGSGYFYEYNFAASTPSSTSGMLTTNELRYYLSSTLFQSGIGILFCSKFAEGSKASARIYGGFELLFGLGKQKINTTTKTNVDWATESAPGTYSVTSTIISGQDIDNIYISNIFLNTRALFPIGMEFSGLSQKMSFITEVKFGFSGYSAKNIKELSGSTLMVCFGARYFFQRD